LGGKLQDLIGLPLLDVKETIGRSAPKGAVDPEYHDESETWTTFVFRTAKTTVTLIWLGTSNGYYSESVSFEKCEA
jgi:hypothetical protein